MARMNGTRGTIVIGGVDVPWLTPVDHSADDRELAEARRIAAQLVARGEHLAPEEISTNPGLRIALGLDDPTSEYWVDHVPDEAPELGRAFCIAINEDPPTIESMDMSIE